MYCIHWTFLPEGEIKILYVLYHVKQNRGEEKNLVCPLISFLDVNYSDTTVMSFVRFYQGGFFKPCKEEGKYKQN